METKAFADYRAKSFALKCLAGQLGCAAGLQPACFPFCAAGGGVLFDVEADFRRRRLGRWRWRVQHICRHDGTGLGEGVGALTRVSVLMATGHNL